MFALCVSNPGKYPNATPCSNVRLSPFPPLRYARCFSFAFQLGSGLWKKKGKKIRRRSQSKPHAHTHTDQRRRTCPADSFGLVQLQSLATLTTTHPFPPTFHFLFYPSHFPCLIFFSRFHLLILLLCFCVKHSPNLCHASACACVWVDDWVGCLMQCMWAIWLQFILTVTAIHLANRWLWMISNAIETLDPSVSCVSRDLHFDFFLFILRFLLSPFGHDE